MFDLNLDGFLVENGDNTSYIDSLLMALFYPTESQILINQLLGSQINDPMKIYLQEIILNHFVIPIRDNFSVLENVMNMIKYIGHHIGFSNKYEYVHDYYSFLHNIFKGTSIEIQKYNIVDNFPVKNGDPLMRPYICINIPDNLTRLSIKKELLRWSNNSRYISNLPNILPIFINRNSHNTEVIIQKKIFPTKLIPFRTINPPSYVIQSIICKSYNSNSYYTIINTDNKWLLFDNKLTPPSLQQILLSGKSSNTDIVEKIKNESVMCFYRYDG